MTNLYPAITNRSSTPLAVSRMLFQVHGDQASILDLQMQLSTGKRFQKPSEDLASAIKVLAAQRQQEFRQQTEINLRSADDILSASETSLAQAQTILNDVRATAVEAAGNTISDDQRTALLHHVDGALRRLTDLANTRFGDQYIFAGSAVKENPLRLAGNAVQFTANHEQLDTVTDYGSTLAANVTANEAFGVKSSQIVGTVDLDPSVDLDTPLSQLNRGVGIRTGAIRLSSGIESVEVDLTDSHTVGDVIQKINILNLGGRQIEVTLNANSLDVDYADGLGGLLRVEEVGSGATAGDLGINNVATSQNSPVVGSDLNPIMTLTTRLSQLFSGSGLPSGESLRITQAGVNYVVNTNGLNTVEDLINRMERTGARIETSIDPTGRFITVQSTESGSQLSIGENGGNLATMLGLRSMTEDTLVSSLNFGNGIELNDQAGQPDIVLTRNDGTQLRIDLDGVQTIGDVMDRINNNASNFNPATRITASLATTGNGIQLSSTAGALPIAVANAGGSSAAIGLGWTDKDNSTATGATSGANNVIAGRDVATVKVDGVFSSLIQLRQAISDGDSEAVKSVWQSMEQDLDRLAIARGLVGTRQQSIDSRIQKSEDEQIRLREIESQNLDADLASVISELTHRQAALQASIQLMGQTARMTLFDYL
jgi:flagellar hook-associated protein 3 FlgL